MDLSAVWRGMAWLFTVLALACAAGIPWLRFQPRVDFDVIGVLWILQNAAPLFVCVLALVLAVAAAAAWLQYVIERLRTG